MSKAKQHEYYTGPITKLPNGGFSQDCDLMILKWDAAGKYVGQWQDDMLDGDGQIFIGAGPNPIVADLTPEQIAAEE